MKGCQTSVYDSRPDPTRQTHGVRASNNVTLSQRGLNVLSDLGLGPAVRELCLPIQGRIIHSIDGALFTQRYSPQGHCLYCTSRAALERLLIQAVRNTETVKIHFQEECTLIDVTGGVIEFKNKRTGRLTQVDDEYVIGADGSSSLIREALESSGRSAVQTRVFPYGFKEIPLTQALVSPEYFSSRSQSGARPGATHPPSHSPGNSAGVGNTFVAEKAANRRKREYADGLVFQGHASRHDRKNQAAPGLTRSMQLSVIICTHNPRPGLPAACAGRAQTTNAAEGPVGIAARGQRLEGTVIRRLGFILASPGPHDPGGRTRIDPGPPARHPGIDRRTSALDDDNLPAENYLALAANLAVNFRGSERSAAASRVSLKSRPRIRSDRISKA